MSRPATDVAAVAFACDDCDGVIRPGDRIAYNAAGEAVHPGCVPPPIDRAALIEAALDATDALEEPTFSDIMEATLPAITRELFVPLRTLLDQWQWQAGELRRSGDDSLANTTLVGRDQLAVLLNAIEAEVSK